MDTRISRKNMCVISIPGHVRTSNEMEVVYALQVPRALTRRPPAFGHRLRSHLSSAKDRRQATNCSYCSIGKITGHGIPLKKVYLTSLISALADFANSAKTAPSDSSEGFTSTSTYCPIQITSL